MTKKKVSNQLKQQVIENAVPGYMVVQQTHKPHTMIEIRPNELTTLIGHNTQPALHGIVGIKAINTPDTLEVCDMLIMSTDPECFRQLAQAFNMAADNLQAVMDRPGEPEPAEATNE